MGAKKKIVVANVVPEKTDEKEEKILFDIPETISTISNYLKIVDGEIDNLVNSTKTEAKIFDELQNYYSHLAKIRENVTVTLNKTVDIFDDLRKKSKPETKEFKAEPIPEKQVEPQVAPPEEEISVAAVVEKKKATRAKKK